MVVELIKLHLPAQPCWAGDSDVCGAIGLINQFSVAVAYESRYFFPEASSKALAFSAPLGGGSIGIV
tara:strand:+ start:812 stop:1012 length:201 start_codon:yes stop_codon:yes gene_type:complete